jgi:hypothetical protein
MKPTTSERLALCAALAIMFTTSLTVIAGPAGATTLTPGCVSYQETLEVPAGATKNQVAKIFGDTGTRLDSTTQAYTPCPGTGWSSVVGYYAPGRCYRLIGFGFTML